MFKRISFYFLALTSTLTASLQEKWVIDESQRGQWEDLLNENGIPLDYLEQILSKYDLAQISFADFQDLEVPDSFKNQSTKEPTLLYREKGIEVYYPKEPRARHHLWIVLERPVENFLEVSKVELAQMKELENTIRKILFEEFGLYSVVTQSNKPQPGQIPNRFTIEIIPGRINSKTSLNVLDKVDCNNYVLFRGKFPTALSSPVEKEQENDLSFWKEALSNPLNPSFSEETLKEPVDDWTQVQTNSGLAKKKLVSDFYQVLTENNLRIKRIPLSSEISNEPLVSEKSGCPFCLEKVVQLQKVYETEFSYLLYNYKSSIPGSHFLIIPKRHVRYLAQLREDEVQDMQNLAQKLTLAMQIETNRSDIKMYIQDGPTVGQTVPHVNMHVLLTPSPLKYMLFSINYEQEQPFPSEKMELLVKNVKERLNHL